MGVTSVKMVEEITKTDRKTRSPRHMFFTEQMPFAIVPFAIAPVLPGETLTNWFTESRFVSNPIQNSQLGWKVSKFLFYVKATDLLNTAIRDMFSDPANVDLSATLGLAANDQKYYTAKGGIPYLKLAVQKIVQHYFRDAGEAWDKVLIDGYPAAQIKEGFWLDSLTDKDDMPEGANIATATDAGDLERLMMAFEQLRALGLAKMDYEDYLKSFGINTKDEEVDRPEMVANFSEFMYPSNTINPADGAAVSALSTVLKKGESSRKFFREPGFLVGISVLRPKVYFGGLAGNLAGHLSRSWDWIPGWNNDSPATTLKRFEAGTGPLGDRTVDTDAYFVDMRDLLVHGDQFQNRNAFDPGVAGSGIRHLAPLPDANLNWKYPNETFAKSLFRDTTTAGLQSARDDGYVSFAIRGGITDMTVGNVASV